MKKIIGLMLLLVLTPNLANAEDWITEEVLKQLSEVRQELKVLQEEVRGLRGQLANNAPSRAGDSAGLAAIDLTGSPSMGDKSAEIAIIEFSDYQCPYCRRHYQQTLPGIEKNYVETGKVKYVMKQFPLGFHAKARGASVAALCVEKFKNGKYFDAHASIFGGETSLDEASYLALADTFGISSKKYKSCLNDPEMSQVVDQDMAQGGSVGVTGTPAFLIGKIKDGKLVDGQLITGARPYASFSNIIDQLL